MKKESILRPSDFYWGVSSIIGLILVIGYELTNRIGYLFSSCAMFVLILFLMFSKKLKNKLDYEESIKEVKNNGRRKKRREKP